MARWDFYQATRSRKYVWRWRNTKWNLITITSKRSFDSYDDCVADAIRHGYDYSLLTVISYQVRRHGHFRALSCH